MDVPDSSAGKKSACNKGHPSLIPGSGSPPWRRHRLSTLEFLGFPDGSDEPFLGWEDPLEEGMAIHSSILAWRIPMDRGAS